MLISQLEGLKFPGTYTIKFFFKEGLDKKKGKVLELGCGNGNNLMMFYQYGWEVIGVDKNRNSIKQAENNFSKCKKGYRLINTYRFITRDMVNFASNYKGSSFDVLLLPDTICYLDYNQIIELFSRIRKNRILKKYSLIFIQTRTPLDYRYGKGKKVGTKTFKLNIEETGEHGCLNTFLTKSELTDILERNFDFKYKHILHCDFDNYQRKHLISNSDIILWGKIKAARKQ